MATLPVTPYRPQQPNMLEMLAGVQGLKNQQSQGQALDLENQQRQIQLKNVQAGTAAMQEWDGKDYNQLPGLYLKHGASADAVLSLKTNIIKQQQDIANLSKDQLANEKTKNDYFAQAIDNVKSLPPEQQPQAFEAAKADAVQKGHLDPQQAQGMQYQGPQQLDILEKSLMGHQAVIEQALKNAQTNEAASRGKEADVNTQKSQAELDNIKQFGGMSPQMVESKYLWLQGLKNKGMNLNADQNAFIKAYEHNKELVPQFKVSMQNSGNGLIPGGGAPIPGAAPASSGAPPANGQGANPLTINHVPPQLRGTVQEILDYRAPMPSSARNNLTNMATRYWVNQLDPTYDETSFPARNSILKSYTSGPESKSINAINTALGHLGELGEASKALSQNNVPLLHSLASKLGAATGSDAATTYTNILHRVSPEMTAAYVQGGGGEGERGANQEDFDVSKGAKQIQSNIAESAMLLRSKISAQENQWNTTYKPTKDSDQFQNRFITPAAKATLDEWSAKAPTNKSAATGGQFTVKTPNGKVYSFGSQADADAFKKKAGI